MVVAVFDNGASSNPTQRGGEVLLFFGFIVDGKKTKRYCVVRTLCIFHPNKQTFRIVPKEKKENTKRTKWFIRSGQFKAKVNLFTNSIHSIHNYKNANSKQ